MVQFSTVSWHNHPVECVYVKILLAFFHVASTREWNRKKYVEKRGTFGESLAKEKALEKG